MNERQHVLDEARRLIGEAGEVIGEDRFQRLSRLSPHLWNGKHWEKFTDVIRELGVEPKEQIKALPIDTICRALAELTRKHGEFPPQRRMKFSHTNNPDFPDERTIRERLGKKKAEQIQSLLMWCSENEEFRDLIPILEREADLSVLEKATAQICVEPSILNNLDCLLPPVIACLDGLAERDPNTVAEFARFRLNEDLEFERRTGLALRLLGLGVTELGQGTGRQADGLALCREYHWGIVYDAKLRTGPFRIGTEDRKFKEYLETHQPELKSAGITNVYFVVISGSFVEGDLPKAQEVVRSTGAKSCVLLTVKALLALVEKRLYDPRSFDYHWLEKQFASTRIIQLDDLNSDDASSSRYRRKR